MTCTGAPTSLNAALFFRNTPGSDSLRPTDIIVVMALSLSHKHTSDTEFTLVRLIPLHNKIGI